MAYGEDGRCDELEARVRVEVGGLRRHRLDLVLFKQLVPDRSCAVFMVFRKASWNVKKGT